MSDNNIVNDNKPISDSLRHKIDEVRADRHEDITQPVPPRKRNSRPLLIGIVAVAAVAILGVVAWLIFGAGAGKDEEEAQQAKEREVIELQQQLANSEFENLENEFDQLETQREMIVNDSIKMQLTEKYEAARLQVEQLKKKLADTTAKSAREIEDLRGQIKTLRELLKHYLEEIDRLNQENEKLRNENDELKRHNEQITTQLSTTTREKEHLSERMALAEKLNVTGVTMSMLNKKDKNEKKIKNARKFVISYTIPQNNSTPVGTKTIYAVITTPEGQLLDGGGTFSFEGGTVTASARAEVEYGGEEIGGLVIYYDIRNALTPGVYTVQLFSDGYALCDPRKFTFK